MGESVLNRINELAKKAKTEGLTEEELAERDALRKQYLKNFRANFERTIMDNVYFVDEDGTKTKAKKKSE